MRKDHIIFIILAVLIPFFIVFFILTRAPTSSELTFNFGKPNIWACDRILIINSTNVTLDRKVIDYFLNYKNFSKIGEEISPIPIEFSCRKDVGRCRHEGKICFSHAVKGNGWIIQWGMKDCSSGEKVNVSCKKIKTCALYFTGIGCPHCAITDPFLFYDFINNHGILLIEYEIYKNSDNSKVMDYFIKEYNIMPGVPQVIFSRSQIILGDDPILENMESSFNESEGCNIQEFYCFFHGLNNID